ncbi:MAG: ABC transporter substrate-binding protein [Candidatus Eremiobacteraeota bacterium]|nr:ABC transporter substrate-binding protein [Candidatus Eremiobacteraeota bacterium]
MKLARSRFLLAGAAGAGAPHVVLAQSSEKIRICGVPTDDLTPVFWAIDNGIYKKNGLDIEFIPTPSGTAATTAVVSGTYELGKASPIAACVAHLKGIPVTVIANGALWEVNNAWAVGVCATDSTAKTGADLNGQTVGTAGLNDLAQLALSAWVDKTGGDSKSLKWIEIPNSAAAAAISSHRIAAIQLNEPFLREAIDSKQVRPLAKFLSAISDSFASTLYLSHPDWANKNKALVERFVKITYETGAYTNAHPAETATLVAGRTKMSLETLRKVTRAHQATSSDPALLQPNIDVAAKYNQIPRAFNAKDLFFS